MANARDKKPPSSVRKERDSFLEDLKRFHNTRGTPIRNVPCLGGREIDLFSLYNRVTALGGWEKDFKFCRQNLKSVITNEIIGLEVLSTELPIVNLNERWEDVQEDFNLPRGCTNISQALKTIYIRYLDVYEKIHFLGEDPDRKTGENEEQGLLPGQRKKTNYASMVPMMYNHAQHHVNATVRESQNFPKLLEPGLTDKLEKSLLSGLPNEIDFAVNICTLLSSEGKHTLQLERCSHLLELLLAHVGLFDVGPGSMRELHLSGWKPVTKRNYLRFWWESVQKRQIRQLICPDIPLPQEESPDSDHCEDIRDLLGVGRDLGLNDKEGQRVLQISMILRNLSFEVDNIKILLSSQLVLRFLMLGIHCKYHSIHQLSLDTLGNLCPQMELKIRDGVTTSFMITTVSQCLKSSDKFEVVTGLDMLSKLCQQESNEEALCDLLAHEVYETIVSFLTVHDIQLIVYTLECLYQLSELGEVSTTHIARISRAISCLISLITIEAQSYGPESIKGIKVVEHIPATLMSPVLAQRPPESVPTPLPTPQGNKLANQKAGASTAAQGGTPNRQKVAPTPPSMRPPVSATPPPGRPTPPPTPPKCDPVLTRWLHCHYESAESTTVSQLEIYLGLVRICGQKKMPDSKQFAIALRTLFPHVDVVSQDKPDGMPEVVIKGIKRRETPIAFQFDRASSATPPPVRFPPSGLGVQSTTGMPSPPSTPQPPGLLRQTQPQRLKFIQYKPSPQPPPISQNNSSAGSQQGSVAAPKPFPVPRPPTPLSPLAVNTTKSTPPTNSNAASPLTPQSPLGVPTTTGTKVPSLLASGGQNPAIMRPTPPQSPMMTTQNLTQTAPMLQQVLMNNMAVDGVTQRQTGPVEGSATQACIANPSSVQVMPNFNTSGGNVMYFGNMQQQHNNPNVGIQGQPNQDILPQGNIVQNPPFMDQQASVPIVPGGFLSQLQMSPPRAPEMPSNGNLSNQMEGNLTIENNGFNNTMPNQQGISNPSQNTATNHPQRSQMPIPQPGAFSGGNTIQRQGNNPVPPKQTTAQLPSPGSQPQTAPPHSPWNSGGFQNQFQQFAQFYNNSHGSCQANTSQTPVSKTKAKKPRPPRVKNPTKSASKRSTKSKVEPSPANVGVDIPIVPIVTVSDAGRCDKNSEESKAIDSHENNLATETAVFFKENCPPVTNEIHPERSKNPSMNPGKEVVLPSTDSLNTIPVTVDSSGQTEPAVENAAEAATTNSKPSQAHCDANTLLLTTAIANEPPVNNTPVNSDTQQPPTQFLPQPSNELVNGLSHGEQVNAPHVAKELSPLFNSSVEEKKAKIAQLLKDTNRFKEHLKGINGVSHQNENSINESQGMEPGVAMATSNIVSSESQVNLDFINNKHASHLLNGYTDPVNGGHLTNNAQTDHRRSSSTGNLICSSVSEEALKTEQTSFSVEVGIKSVNNCGSLPSSVTLPSGNVQLPGDEVSPVVKKDSLPPALGMQVDGCNDGSDDEQMDTSERSGENIATSQVPLSMCSTIPLYSISNTQPMDSSAGIVLSSQSLVSSHAPVLLGNKDQGIVPNQASIVLHSESQPSIVLNTTTVNIPSVQSVPSLLPSVTIASNSVSAGPLTEGSVAMAASTTVLQKLTQPSQPSQKLIPIQPRPGHVAIPTSSHAISSTQQQATTNLFPSTTQLVMAGGVQTAGSTTQLLVAAAGGGGVQPQGATQLVLAGGVQQPALQPGSVQISLPPGVQVKGQGQTYIQYQGQSQVMPSHLQQFVATHGQTMQSAPPNSFPPSLQTPLQPYTATSQGHLLTSQNQTTPKLIQGPTVQPQQTQQVVATNCDSGGQFVPTGQQVIMQAQQVQFVTSQNTQQQQQPVVQQQQFAQSQQVMQHQSQNSGQLNTAVLNNPQMFQAAQMNLVQSSVSQTVQNNSYIPYSSVATPLGNAAPLPGTPQIQIPQPEGGGGASCEPSPQSIVTSPIPSPVAVPKRRASTKKGDRPKKAKKSRTKSTDSGKGGSASPGVASPPPVMSPLLYLCEWNGCNRAFEVFKSLSIHVNKNHLDLRSGKGLCHWAGCDQLIRQKWSLITHIQEKHLSEPIGRAAALKRQQLALTSNSTPAALPQHAPPPPVYPDDAALQAIRRFTMKPPYAEFTEMKEGPVTKHIRLTSALILRNLARYSTLGRSALKKYEHQLAYVALSPVESSAAVTNCLYELHKHYQATETEK